MQPVDLDARDLELLGTLPRTREVLAKDHETYKPLPSVRIHLPESPVVTRWTFTEQERTLIAAGGDLYIAAYTHGRPLQPLMATAGIPPCWEYETDDPERLTTLAAAAEAGSIVSIAKPRRRTPRPKKGRSR